MCAAQRAAFAAAPRTRPALQLQFDMLEVFARRAAVEHRLSADDVHDFRAQKFRHVLRDRIRIRFGVLQNVDLDDLASFKRLGERIQKVFRNAALADLRDGRKIRDKFAAMDFNLLLCLLVIISPVNYTI